MQIEILISIDTQLYNSCLAFARDNFHLIETKMTLARFAEILKSGYIICFGTVGLIDHLLSLGIVFDTSLNQVIHELHNYVN